VVVVEHGAVIDVAATAPDGVEPWRLPPGSLLAPGFVDLQVNGGDGVLFNDAPTPAGLRRIADAHALLGTTSLLPTLISANREIRRKALDAVASGVPGVRGIHIEGPFIAPARRGIHPAESLSNLTSDDLGELTGACAVPRLLTVAPEIVPPHAISALVEAGVIVSIGHTDAAETAVRASLDAGATLATHLFNAMSPFAPRAPGAVGAILDHATVCAGMIADGYHVHPAAMRLAHRVLGPDRLFLVSDAMPTVGCDAAAEFRLGGEIITLRQGRLTSAAGTLAGAHLSMADSVRYAVRGAGIPLPDALRMATATPADGLGLRQHGRIRVGARADFVALDATLRVTAVWRDGELLVRS
jgi:N-acetylglucosamine-6-phosphate deacetylase